MKVILLAFVLLSVASSQTPSTNSTTYENNSQSLTEFRKCVREKCSERGCSCESVLNEEFLKYDYDKLGTCISSQWFYFDITQYCIEVKLNDRTYWSGFFLSDVNDSMLERKPFEEPTLRYAFWIICFFVIAGNAYVIVNSFVRTSCFKQAWPSASLQCNHIVILNIAVADILMGIYLITISILNVVYSGFRHFNIKWRSSLGCSILGILTVISSEASCFLMVTLTSFRLFHVYQPLSSMTASSWPWKVCIFMSWLVAVFLGVFPILESSDYFVNSYVMKNAYGHLAYIRTREIEQFGITLAKLDRSNFSNHEFKSEIEYMNRYFPRYAPRAQFDYSLASNLSYQDFRNQRDMIKFLSIRFLSYIPEGQLGFYGRNDICLPVLFFRHWVGNWEYTIALITLNLACFVFIAISYILIYMRSTKKRPINAASTADVEKLEAEMQRRIARIIITDFLCWVPLCIMAYAFFIGWSANTDTIFDVAGLLLPINSVLNPFLYSVSFSKLFEKLRCQPITRCRT